MKKQISIILISLCMFFQVSNIFATQNVNVFTINDTHFVCEVFAPQDAKIGEEFTIEFLVRPWSTIQVDRIYVKVHGNIGYEGEWSFWNYTWQNMTMYIDAQYRQEKTIFISPLASSVGEIYGEILAVYDWNGQRYVESADFAITKVYPKTYDEMKTEYNSLNQTYQNVQTDNNSLKNNLAFYQNLLSVLAVTTIVFACTTVFFAIRKPKTKPQT